MDVGDTNFEKSSPDRLVRRPVHTLQLSPRKANGGTNGHSGGPAEANGDVDCTIELRRYEFGGSFGVALLFWLSPIFLFCVNLALLQNYRKLNLLMEQFPSILWRSLQDWQAYLLVVGWLFVHGAFYRFTFIDVSRNAVWGRQLADGVSCLVTSLCLVALCALCGFAVHVDAWLVRHRLGLVASSVVTSFVLALWFYWSSFKGVHALGLTLDCNGSPPYDMFIGRQLNPRVCNVVDVKLVLFRQALVAWAVQIALSVVAVHASRIDVNWPMIVLAATQLLYIFDALWYEEQLLNTFAMLHDGVGWMQLFGSLCVVPFLFSVPMCYLGELKVPVTPSMMCSLPHLAIFALGYYITRCANSEKWLVRQDWKISALKDKKLVHTYKASFPLYADGWWGWVRHPNYTGEVIMAVAWTSLCGFGHFLPYTYLFYLVVHLSLRTGRQERRLRLDYATPWLDYCDLVPYRVVPKVW